MRNLNARRAFIQVSIGAAGCDFREPFFFKAQLTLISQAWTAGASGRLSLTVENTLKHPLTSPLELKVAFEEGRALALLCALWLSRKPTLGLQGMERLHCTQTCESESVISKLPGNRESNMKLKPLGLEVVGLV